ncbi:nuclear hormone receptor HR96 isoform X2 [Leptidea sinapis]|uniref:nuclear hormone receptor HR96 isoform X2 n=1 Tax=Leptidea sinapis TaxID=189913 RepID=UPI0021335057|nr:nuclear hormone receptor HR96 isoform X2 [Leptidea sinapis]
MESDKKGDDTGGQKKETCLLQKICLICGDKALGYNFNAISCESCKAFFRRNALTNKVFKCPFANNCEITVVTRRFCQKCRLEKCFKMGMVKEFIMSDEDKAEKRRKIEENRAKKRQILECEDGVSSSKHRKEDPLRSPACDTSEKYDVNSTTCSPHSTMRSPGSTDLENSHSCPVMCNQYAPQVDETYSIKVYPIDGKTVINRAVYENRHQDPYVNENPDSMCSESSKTNSIRSVESNGDSTFTEPHHVSDEAPSTSISDPDVNKAREILQDVERIEPNSMESILCEAIKLEFEANTSLNSCRGSSRELNEVERAKLNELIVANKALHAPIDDDLLQLVGDTPSQFNFPGFKDIMSKSGEDSPDPLLVSIVNLTAVAIRRFIKMAKKINAFKNMCEEDQVALLKGGCIEMMVLRSTMTYDVQRNQWKNSYYYLLRRYLESIYPGCEAKSTFLKLIQKTVELRRLAAEVTGVYLDVNPIEPLLMEIFDLKHHPT